MRIEDILEAINNIEEYTSGMDFSAWQADRKTVDAVIRNIEVIGEAATHVPMEIQNKYCDVPWKKMKGIRNILIHEYFGVDVEVVWQTIQKDLGPLKKALEVLEA
jgi:uncharacterized protein with HEPN domain